MFTIYVGGTSVFAGKSRVCHCAVGSNCSSMSRAWLCQFLILMHFPYLSVWSLVVLLIASVGISGAFLHLKINKGDLVITISVMTVTFPMKFYSLQNH